MAIVRFSDKRTALIIDHVPCSPCSPLVDPELALRSLNDTTCPVLRYRLLLLASDLSVLVSGVRILELDVGVGALAGALLAWCRASCDPTIAQWWGFGRKMASLQR